MVRDWEIYRDKAQHCLLTADKVPDPDVRLALFKLANNYTTLADYLERHHAQGAAHRGDRDRPKDS